MFILAHLSDPHLAPLPEPTLAELLGKRMTGYLNWRRKRHLIHRSDVLARIVADLKGQTLDHIAVTGDLINISLPYEYAHASAFLQSLGSPSDVTLVPGNHDIYVRSAAREPRIQWGDYMRGDDHSAAFPTLRQRGPLALIGLSTAVPTPPFFATGRLGDVQLKRLADLLDRCVREDLCRVLLIHHPPLSSHPSWAKRLTDAQALRAVIARHGAELVLHGHDHARSLVWLDGPDRKVPVVGVPSASEAPPGEHDPAGYNLYRIERQFSGWRIDMESRGLSRDGNVVAKIKDEILRPQ
jgi:3',5'-cyclic AMP phosphodiesterase CpdA